MSFMLPIRLQAPNGALISISVGSNAMCIPRNDEGPYTAVDIGVWGSNVPTSWEPYQDGFAEPGEIKIYGYLPVALLAEWFTLNTAKQE